MSRYVDAEYVKAVMLNDRLMQGNAEFTLYVQQVETQVNALPSIDIVRCGECKYAHMTYGGECKYCDKWSLEDSLYLDGDFFCSYGCRSEKPNNSERSSE